MSKPPKIVAGEEFKVVLSDDAREDLADDPKLAEAFADVIAKIRQALDGVDVHDEEEIARRMDAVGAKRVDDDDIPGPVRAQIEAARNKKLS